MGIHWTALERKIYCKSIIYEYNGIFRGIMSSCPAHSFCVPFAYLLAYHFLGPNERSQHADSQPDRRLGQVAQVRRGEECDRAARRSPTGPLTPCLGERRQNLAPSYHASLGQQATGHRPRQLSGAHPQGGKTESQGPAGRDRERTGTGRSRRRQKGSARSTDIR